MSNSKTELKNTSEFINYMRSNALMVIFPYKYEDTWVFDDADVDLIKEPFVFGIPEMIETLVADIESAGEGFKLIFSQNAFPGYQLNLHGLERSVKVTGIVSTASKKAGYAQPCSSISRLPLLRST